MGSIIEALGRNFERFLRWVYPGTLVLLLLHLGNPDLLTQFTFGKEGIFGLIVLIIVFSFISYSIHRLFIHEILLLRIFFYHLKPHSPLAKLRDAREGLKYWQYEKMFLKERFDEINITKEFSDYMFYRWAVTHAAGITAWILLFIPLLMWLFPAENSGLWGFRFWLLGAGFIFLIAYVYESYALTGVEEVFIERYQRSQERAGKKTKGKKMNWRVLINRIVLIWLAFVIFFLTMGFSYWNLSKKEIGQIVIKKPEMGVWEPNWSTMMRVVSEVNEFIEDFNEGSRQQNQTAAIVSFVTSAAAFISMCLASLDAFRSQGGSGRMRGERASREKSRKQ